MGWEMGNEGKGELGCIKHLGVPASWHSFHCFVISFTGGTCAQVTEGEVKPRSAPGYGASKAHEPSITPLASQSHFAHHDGGANPRSLVRGWGLGCSHLRCDRSVHRGDASPGAPLPTVGGSWEL